MNGLRFLNTFTDLEKKFSGSKEISKREKLCRKSGIQYIREYLNKNKKNKADDCSFHVGAAIIKNDKGEILVCQRNENTDCELLWEFPGGKKEKNEHYEECVIRECKEELGIDIEIEERFAETEFQYSHAKIAFVFFLTKIISGTPVLNVHRALKWVKPLQMRELEFCPADIEIVNKLQKKTEYYDNIVRDNVYDILRKENKVCVCKKLCGDELFKRLSGEISQKLERFYDNNSLDDFCDALEMLKACGAAKGYSAVEVENACKEKFALQGGYYKGFLLKEISQEVK